MTERPDVIIVMTDEERAIPAYETDDVRTWRERTLAGQRWFDENGVSFTRHYTGSLACVPSRPTIFTGQYPDLHGVTQTDGIGKVFDDSRMRWLRRGEVPTLGISRTPICTTRPRVAPWRPTMTTAWWIPLRCNGIWTPIRWRTSASPDGWAPNRTARWWPTPAYAATR